ncbi:MAG: DUF2807 domain-containing protein [Bacteroidia bacterium]|jgi:hypothetical protein|tara:strand:+ start:467 stop:1198 length:732 start_codon:yes stop_codon:yes gene_type:complete
MKKWIYISLICLSFGCGDDNRCLKSLGDEAETERNIDGYFDALYVEDRIKVRLVQDSVQAGKLIFRGPKNLLSSIGAVVQDGELRLTNNNTCNFLRSFDYILEVDVYLAQLNRLGVESIAEVKCKDTLRIDRLEVFHNALSSIDLLVKGNEIYVESHNSASTILRGRVNVLKGSIEEVSDLDAKELLANNVLLDTHSPLDSKINALKGYFLNIYNAGNIEQFGNASEYQIVNEQTSTGAVIQK